MRPEATESRSHVAVWVRTLQADKTSAKVEMWLTHMRNSREAGANGRNKRRAKGKVR